MEKLDVLYTIDKNYIDIMLGSVISLILNGNIIHLRIHVVCSDFDLEDYHKIESILYAYNSVELYFYDVCNFDINRFNIPKWHGTQIANVRLFFQEYLSSNMSIIENLLYLDADTIVVSSLQGLDIFKESLVGAVRDEISNKYLQKMGGLSNYFNSGVLFFNANEWIQSNSQDRIIHFLEDNHLSLTFPDQDIFNCSLDGHITQMPLNYNLGSNAYLLSPRWQQYYFDKKSGIPNQAVEEAKKKPIILHSTGFLGLKPWLRNSINPYNEEFMKYILMASPNFQKRELTVLKKVLTASPAIYKIMFLVKMNMPYIVNDFARKLVK